MKNRREFLKSSVAAATAPAFLPAILRGETAPSNRINIAMIGMGRQAKHANLPFFL